ncbi:MAG: HNH endonuclease [Candidatus Marinimicrobia bacterium]|nr:HNH endonuclease [Candidatus Neomarinimicrobiota bacterium]MCF7828576.1 HNH endonuclease [Candidatus Neomarinimicrobiota bacterium]MCF7880317.1 HNH endonuclease [Candidatus Neomarinimicrobiota bacterium]
MSGNGILNRQVLVLNQNYEPLQICNAKHAIVMLYLNRVELVESDGVMVHSVNDEFPLPTVVRVKRYINYRGYEVVLSRKNIMRRDEFKCQYCGKHDSQLTIDHVTPKRHGGKDTWENLVTACIRCNNTKGDNTPEQANMPLLKQPKKPHYIQFLKQHIDEPIQSWKPYIYLG